MEKYKIALIDNIRKQLDQWFIECQPVGQTDLYRFLHSIYGTSAIIGINDLSELSKKLLDELDEAEQKQWEISELKDFLYPVLTLCFNGQIISEGIEREYKEKAQKELTGDEPVILVIDDDTTFLMFIKEELENHGWMVKAAADMEKGVSSFYDLNPDCILIDVYMKEKNGFEVLDFLNKKLKHSFIPTIMISSENTREVRINSYEKGADAFVAKDIDIAELKVIIQNQLDKKEWVQNLLLIDELTRVYNRKYLKKAYEQIQADSIRRYEPFSIAVLDIDYFKNVNDTYGHLKGDEVLASFAQFLQTKARKNDIVVRFGGEEFVLLLPSCQIKDAYNLLNRLLQDFRIMKFISDEGIPFSCTFSAGVVEAAEPDKELEYWLGLADNALYEAKESGRNAVKVHASQDMSPAKRKVHVAVVDDDPIVRTVLSELLEKINQEGIADLEIRAFRDGTAFFSDDWHLTSGRHLVLVDGIMPKMDGLEVLQRVKELSGKNRYTVIMLTSRKSDSDISRALELGADDYITKPFKLTELEARIRHLLKRMK